MFTRNALRLGAVLLGCAVLALALGGCKPAPTVISTTPADGATAVPTNTTVTATFSRAIGPDGINASTFTLFKGATPVPGLVTYDADTLTATFTPDAPLDKESLYTATIAKGTGAEKSVSSCIECYGPFLAVPVAIGIIAALATPPPGLAEDYVWSFTTAAPAPPTANAGPDRQVNLPIGANAVDVTLDGSGSTDPTKSIATYTWTGTPDPEDVINPTVSLGPGPHVFTLTVTNNEGLSSAPDMVTIFVNLPPVADAEVNGDQQINIPAGATTANATLDSSLSHDPDGTVVAWAWTGDPDPEDVANPTVILGPGVHVFTLIVTDNMGAVSQPDTITITVNTPPVANAGPDQIKDLPQLYSKTAAVAYASTVEVTLDGSASHDIDGTIVSYEWTGTPDPTDVASPTVTLGAGEHVFSLVVTDDDGAVSVADTVTILVNTPPVAEAGPDQHVNIPLGASLATVTLDGSGSHDTDGTISGYTWVGTPDPWDVVSPVVSLTAGTHVFNLNVTDNNGATSAVDAVTIYVNAPPIADAGPDQSLNLPMLDEKAMKTFASTMTVNLDGSGSHDPDGLRIGGRDALQCAGPAVEVRQRQRRRIVVG